MSGFVVWLTGDRSRMHGLAEAFRPVVAARVRGLDVLTAETVEEKLCSNENRGADFDAVVDRRLGWLSHLLARNGCGVIALAGSPRAAVRAEVAKMVGPAMLEVRLEGALPAGYEASEAALAVPAGESPSAAAARLADLLGSRGFAAR